MTNDQFNEIMAILGGRHPWHRRLWYRATIAGRTLRYAVIILALRVQIMYLRAARLVLLGVRA